MLFAITKFPDDGGKKIAALRLIIVTREKADKDKNFGDLHMIHFEAGQPNKSDYTL
jgi:hypothetical protein